MSANVRIKLIDSGVKALLRSPEISTAVTMIAGQVAGRAGSGYMINVHDSGQRTIANVYPASKEAAMDNAKNNTLLKSL